MVELITAKWALSIKVWIPQIMAAILAASLHIPVGVTLAYSAVLIPQVQNSTNTFQISDTEAVWIIERQECMTVLSTKVMFVASCVTLIMPLSAIISGLFMDRFGRLAVLKLSVIPGVVGWTIIALARNTVMLLIGRVFTGFAMTWASNSTFVYVSEISSANVRGALLGSIPLMLTIGLIVTYLKGFFLDWKIIAWISNVYTLATLILILFIPESPQWLVSRHRLEEAKKSLEWFNKYRTVDNQSLEELSNDELMALQATQKQREEKHQNQGKLRQFLLPTAYKPLVILTMLFFIQQFSGVHIVMMNAVYFFTAFRAKIDPYLASTYMAVVRFPTMIVFIWLMKRYPRRGVLMVSGLGMAICMIISAMFTKWIQEGTSDQTLVPLCMTTVYFLFMTGVYSIPFTSMSELFPLAIRGVASTVVYGISALMMFAALQSFHSLEDALGGLSAVQYFFGFMSLIGVAFTFICVPETHNKTLCEIEEYFWTNTFSVSSYCCETRKEKNTRL